MAKPVRGDYEMRASLSIVLVFILIIGLGYPAGISYATTMTFYSDGIIQDGDVYDIVEVYDTPPARTTVNMTGGSVGYPGMSTFDTSVVNISDGFVCLLQTNDSSTVNLSGSAFIEDEIRLYNSSTLNFRGGAWEAYWGYLVASDSSTLNVYDGIVGLVSMANVETRDTSTANIYGGSGHAPYVAYGSSTINIYDGRVGSLGGAESSVVNIYGGEIGARWGFGIYQSATANIYGYDFFYDPQARWEADGWVGKLTGDGIYGTPIIIWGIADSYSSSNIYLIPEPASGLLLALGAMTLPRRRRRK